MSYIKKQLDKIFQVYYQSGINNRYVVVRDVTCLLFLKSIGDYPNTYLSYFGIEQTLLEKHGNWKWSNILSFGLDGDVQKIFQTEIMPFFHDSLKGFGFANLAFSDGIGILSPANFYTMLGAINDIFIHELDGKAINGNNIIIYDDIYENLLECLSSVQNSWNYAPRHLRRLLCELIQIKHNDRVYDPNMGYGGLLIEAYNCMICSDVPKYRVSVDEDGFNHVPRYISNLTTDYFRRTLVLEGNENDDMLKWLCLMNFYFHRISLMQSQFEMYDKFKTLEEDLYDKVLCVQPRNGYYENINTVFQCLKQGGRAAVVLPQLFLYGDSRKVKKIRKTLLSQFAVEGVITLPEYEFYPFSHVATAIIIFGLTGENRVAESDVWLCNLKNDGYSNDKKRVKTSDSPLPILLDAFRSRREFDNEWFQCKKIPLLDIFSNEYSLFVDEYIDNAKETEMDVDPREIIDNLVKLQDKLKSGISELKKYF